MPTPMTIEMEADERQAALDAFERIIDALVSYQVHSGLGHEHVYMDIVNCRAALQKKSEKTSLSSTSPVRDALSSQTEAACAVRVPVIEGLDEAMSVINKFIRARDAEIDFLPEKSIKNTSEWISHFMHNVNYTLSFNDWMNLDKVRAYAELQKGN